MKKLFLLFLSQMGIAGLVFGQQDQFSISGLTAGFEDSTVVYLHDEEISDYVDSAYILGNHFLFHGRVDGYKRYWIQCHVQDRFEYKSIWVVNSDMIFDARNSSFKEAIVSGSYLQDQANKLADELKYKKSDSLRNIARRLSSADSIGIKKLRKQLDENRLNEKEKGTSFVKRHPDYLISAHYLTFLKNRIPKSQTQELYNALHADLKQTAYGKTVKTWLQRSVNLKAGDSAVDFSLPNLTGESIALSSFRGKYVLLEFGATGCGPCRRENPNLLKAYKKYNEKGFEIVSVWLDKNRTHWEQTVIKDQMIWTTLSDLNGDDGVVPVTYNIHYIPRNFLLNPNGEIIAEDLRGEKLQQELEKLFVLSD